MLHQRNKLKVGLSLTFLAGFGVLMIAAGLIKALEGGGAAFLSVVPFVMGAVPLAFTVAMLKAIQGQPDRLALTPDGVQISRGKKSYLLPSSQIHAFGVVPVKTFRSLNVWVDDTLVPSLPEFVSRLGGDTPPGQLRLVHIGEKPRVSLARAAEARRFVLDHALGEWHDQPKVS